MLDKRLSFGSAEDVRGFDWQVLKTEIEELSDVELEHSNFDAWLERLSDLAWVPSDAERLLFWEARRDIENPLVDAIFSDFRDDIQPQLATGIASLESKAVESGLQSSKYEKALVNLRRQKQILDADISDLKAKDQELALSLSKAYAGESVTFRGKEFTRAQAAARLKETRDFNERRLLWEATQATKMLLSETLLRPQRELLTVRRQLAAQAQLDNYADYVSIIEGHDFTPAQALNFTNAIGDAFSGLITDRKRQLAERAGHSPVPWGAYAAEGFEGSTRKLTGEEYAAITKACMYDLDSDFGTIAEAIVDSGSFDLLARKGKAHNNYASFIHTDNRPLIFGNATGAPAELKTIMHEFAHGIHFSLTYGPDTDVWTYFGADDLIETVARFLEVLGMRSARKLGYISEAEYANYISVQTEFFLSIFEISTQRSRFQHWLYSRSAHEFTLQDADAYYLDTVNTYGVSWDGYTEALKRQWSYPSNFSTPFTDVNYCVSLVAHFTILEKYDSEPDTTIRILKMLMSQGGRKSLSDLMAALNLPGPTEPASVEIARHYLVDQT